MNFFAFLNSDFDAFRSKKSSLRASSFKEKFQHQSIDQYLNLLRPLNEMPHAEEMNKI